MYFNLCKNNLIVLILYLCQRLSSFCVGCDTFSATFSSSPVPRVWTCMDQLSAITVARPLTRYTRGELLSLRLISPVRPCLDVRRAYTIIARPRGRRAGRNLQRPIAVRTTSRDRRVYVVKRRIMNESLSRSFLSMVSEGEDASSVNAVQQRSICRRSDKIRPGLTRPTISHEPPITRIGSLQRPVGGQQIRRHL